MATIPIIGKSNVGGVWKDISGGYVNIGGVWKPIVKTYVNVGGVWKDAWKNLYTWEKYNTVVSTSYVDTAGSEITYEGSMSVNVSSTDTYTFDSSTGKYTLDNPARGRITALKAGKYFNFTDSGNDGTIIYECVSNTVVNNQHVIVYKERTATVKTTYSRGSYIGTVTSENSSAYPANGRHSDGYWYVKQ